MEVLYRLDALEDVSLGVFLFHPFAVLDLLVQLSAGAELHHDLEVLGVLEGLVHPANVRVVQELLRRHLGVEPLGGHQDRLLGGAGPLGAHGPADGGHRPSQPVASR